MLVYCRDYLRILVDIFCVTGSSGWPSTGMVPTADTVLFSVTSWGWLIGG